MLSRIKHKVSEGGKKIKDKVGDGAAALILKAVGVTALLVAFFLLGNLFGDRVAAPIVSKIGKTNLSSMKQTAPSAKPKSGAPSGDRGEIIPPGEGATEEDRVRFSEAIRMAGVETDTISLSESCAFDPFVARVKYGEVIKFKNDGTKETTVAIHRDLLTISAKASKTFDTGTVNMGIYGLVCGQNVGVGYLEITP